MNKVNWRLWDVVFILGIHLIAKFIVVDFWLEPLLTDLGLDSVIIGVITGLFLACVALTAVYLFGIQKNNLSFRDLGFHPEIKIRKHLRLILIYTLLALVTAGFLLYIMYEVIGVGPNERSNAVADPNVLTLTLALLSAAVISPFYEEVVYRGFIYENFRKHFNLWPAILLNAIIFSLVHLPSLDILPVNIVNGILFALAYEKTRSIYVPMIIHGLFNGILFLGVLIGN